MKKVIISFLILTGLFLGNKNLELINTDASSMATIESNQVTALEEKDYSILNIKETALEEKDYSILSIRFDETL